VMHARPETEIVAIEPAWGPESIEGFFEGFVSAASLRMRFDDVEKMIPSTITRRAMVATAFQKNLFIGGSFGAPPRSIPTALPAQSSCEANRAPAGNFRQSLPSNAQH